MTMMELNPVNNMGRREIPEPVTGYELTPEDIGEFFIVVPEATVNLVNRCISSGDGTWNTYFYKFPASVTLSDEANDAYSGWGCLKVTPTTLEEFCVYADAGALTSGSNYTFSIFIKGRYGEKFSLRASSSGTPYKKKFTANGFWQRLTMTFQATALGPHTYLYVYKEGGQNKNPFYVDMWQLENKSYPTTPVHGWWSQGYYNQMGTRWTNAEYWATYSFNSASYRKAWAWTGGREWSLKDLGFRITGITGLGLLPQENILDTVNNGGSYYHRTVPRDRPFTIVGTFTGKTMSEVSKQVAVLHQYLDMVNRLYDLPILIKYRIKDDFGGYKKTIDIPCLYVSGLEGSIDNIYQRNISIQFNMFRPLMQDERQQCHSLGYQSSIPNCDTMIARNGTTGAWQSPVTGAHPTGWTDGVKYNPVNGLFYVFGDFTSINGDASLKYIVSYNFATNTFAALGASTNGPVLAVDIDSHGHVVCGGTFTTAGGLAVNYLAYWNIITGAWGRFNTNCGADNTIDVIKLHPNTAIIYIGGDFNNAIDSAGANVPNTDHIAYFSGTWAAGNMYALASVNAPVAAIELYKNTTLIIGGGFTNAGGDANADGIAQWSTVAGNWVKLGGPAVAAVGSAEILALLYDTLTGNLYIGGGFTSLNGVSTVNFAFWNGTQYVKLCDSMSAAGLGAGAEVFGIVRNPLLDELFVYGAFVGVNGIAVPDAIVRYNHNNFLPLDADLDTTTLGTVTHVDFDTNGNYVIIISTKGTGMSSSISGGGGSGKAYPIFNIRGPGILWEIRNWDTGKALFFKGLYINDAEWCFIDTRDDWFKVRSGYRPYLESYLLPGSDTDFFLLPGQNNIGLFAFQQTTADTYAYMIWRDTYSSLETAYTGT